MSYKMLGQLRVARYLLILLLLHLPLAYEVVYSQANISGTINVYTSVNAISYPNNSVTVSSTSGFAIGDQVVLIQMKGATIDQTDAATYGTITNYNDAGNYEILIICDIIGNEVIFDDVIMNTYTPSGIVQLIYMPVYSGNATISGGDLTATAWNGTTGGVLALEVAGTLDFGSQNINLNGRGFRGGNTITSSGSCNFVLDATYYLPSTNTSGLAFKGEGITEQITGKETGRGPQANGGGGGNNHNAGGSGGGNYGAGGAGGERKKSSNFTCGGVPGINSKNLQAGYTSGKVFLGGGAGAGHDNNALTAFGSGEDGGGIVIIRAGSINGNNRSILAAGLDMGGPANEDGGGGGGAGGAVFIESGSFSGNLNVDISGGNGASTNNSGSSNCNGPGGGGGGGILYLSSGSLPAGISVNATGGNAGTILTTNQTNCTIGSTNQALNGQAGTTLFNLALNESTVPFAGCVIALPVDLYEFTHNYNEISGVDLFWTLSSEINNDYFSIYRGNDGQGFSKVGSVDGAGNSSQTTNYHFNDPNPEPGLNYYRLSQTDFNGHETVLETITVMVTPTFKDLKLYPNPTNGNATIEFSSDHLENQAFLLLTHSSGKLINSIPVIIDKGHNEFDLDTAGLQPGVYYILIKSTTGTKAIKLIKI